jgi:transcriptional regulator with GAF, ATPase, and Fis domain
MAALDLAADLESMASLVSGGDALEVVLNRALATLEGLVAYDLAAVLRERDGELRVVAARGRLASDAVRAHRVSLADFPTVRRALELRRPIALTADHHESHEGDPYDDVLGLPEGHGCMVVPLWAGGRDLGVITLDREACGVFTPETVSLVGLVGQLVALALWQTEQAALLDRYRHQLEAHGRQLREDLGGGSRAVAMLESTRSPAMKEVVEVARQVAASPLAVLISGETGSGKEVFAHAVHAWSRRSEGPFVALNCAALPEQLVESELFGHVRGAFSGAERARAGRFATANGGTLFLDEVGELPMAAQAKLLRVLQEGTFEPVGSDDTVRVDVRVVAATRVDLLVAVADGRFREDLYYRLAVVPLRVPPLRDRPEDLFVLASGVLEELGGRWELPEPTRQAMRTHAWPGNVRELRHALSRASVLVSGGALSPAALGLLTVTANVSIQEDTQHLPTFEQAERVYFEEVLRRSQGKLYGPDGGAAMAGLKPTTMRSRLVRLGLR